MKIQEHAATIVALRDDNNYYGELGRRYLSTSDIKALVSSPLAYGKESSEQIFFIKGNYFHRRILQPELIKDFIICDAGTRNAKAYKELVEEHWIEGMEKPIFLLSKEVEEMEGICKKIESNEEFVDALQSHREPFDVEEPMIGEILGYQFKAKADRINNHRGFIADLKSTRSLSSFRSQFKVLGYHAQAYVYGELFGMPMRFYVVDKESGRLGVYDVSEKTLNEGKEYVKWGLEKLEMYYGENPTEQVEQYYDYLEL